LQRYSSLLRRVQSKTKSQGALQRDLLTLTDDASLSFSE
jgi:hypothetical protein